ncbi:MAG: hypothetical protein WCV93_02775 [Candidatus Shapirobacteria bacterium]|jgi:hypothetical protein
MAEFRRSRLERKEEDQITRKTIILGVVTLLVFVSVLVFGLPLLVKFSIVLGEVKSRREKIVEEKVIPPPQPRLIVAYEATNSATINVGGVSEPGLEIELLKDDVLYDKTNASETGEFVFEQVSLDKGSNLLTAIATSEKSGSSEPSKPTTVIYDDMPPTLTMTNPSEATLTVDYADFDIVGQAEKGANVTVNGRLAMVDDSGNFKLKFQLSPGKNPILILVRDLAGNEAKREIEITYDI